MPTPLRPPCGDLPDSLFAEQLRHCDPSRPFPPELEAEYERCDLAGNRGLIRTICTCAAILAVEHSGVQLVAGSGGAVLYAELGAIVAISLVLGVLAWDASLERRYRPWANVLVPLRGTVVVAHLVDLAAHGAVVFLMTLPVMVVGAFFFLGLKFRFALLSSLLCAGSFVLCAVHFHLAAPIALRACIYLAFTLVTCSIGARQLERRSRTSFLESHVIAEMAQRDALTGARNRRSFDEHLVRIWHDAAASRRSLAIILIDVDHFKAYNDRYGHLAGDEALRRVARAVQGFVRRPLDLLARYGGEEFGVILYDATGSEARAAADRMRRAVMELALEHLGSRTAETVTISLGVAAVEPTLLREYRGALQLADQALYQAKMRGRNCVELLDDSQYRLLVTGVFANSSFAVEPAGEPPREVRCASAIAREAPRRPSFRT
jgi:diguanylate cyclase (GGDEF)-like protein